MNSGIIDIFIYVFGITLMIYCGKNIEDIKRFFEEKKEKKSFRIIENCIFVIVFIVFVFIVFDKSESLIRSIKRVNILKENTQEFKEYDSKIFKENEIYSNIINNNYDIEKSYNPYIPNGFTYKEGTWDTGYVIVDNNGNEYVWVPCSNKVNGNIPKLEKVIFSSETFISKDICINEGCEKFLTNALKNGGFYVSRFEIGKENEKAVSKKDVDIYGNITVEEAKKIVDEMYKDESFTIELINGYAYDTMLTWIKNTNNVEVTELQEKCKTGRNSYNNIYDCFDNIYELSNEETYGSIVVRGFMKDDNFSEEKMDEVRVKEEGCERLSILKEDNFLNLDSILGFRTIIY